MLNETERGIKIMKIRKRARQHAFSRTDIIFFWFGSCDGGLHTDIVFVRFRSCDGGCLRDTPTLTFLVCQVTIVVTSTTSIPESEAGGDDCVVVPANLVLLTISSVLLRLTVSTH